jgi:myo-inositol-1(or 4)-monophosphatase
MGSPSTSLEYDWLGACRRSVAGVRDVLAQSAPGPERVRETGVVGVGGDRTLVIDQRAEDLVIGELRALHDDGARFTLVSEECGAMDFGDSGTVVVVDPIDGSLNAKRGLPTHGLSVAVADGPTMADVALGYVHDFGTGEEWWAERGAGAWLDGALLEDLPPERRTSDGRLEVVAVESAAPRWLAASADALLEHVRRVRAMGSIAISLCQVAAARADAMASLRGCRSVDAAAAQLIVRESGGLVAFATDGDPLSMELADLGGRIPVAAARTAEGLAQAQALHAT